MIWELEPGSCLEVRKKSESWFCLSQSTTSSCCVWRSSHLRGAGSSDAQHVEHPISWPKSFVGDFHVDSHERWLLQSRVCRPGLSLVRQCGIARRNPSSLETGKAKNSAVDMVFLKKETKGGRLILIWNMEDDSIDWIAGLKALYGRFEDGTFPQFATMKWRKVWETEAAKELFQVLPEVWDAHVPQVREAFCNLVFFFLLSFLWCR